MASETLQLGIDSRGAQKGAREFVRATDQVKRGATGASRQAGQTAGAFDGLRRSLFSVKGVMVTMGFTSLAGTMALATKRAMEFGTAMAEVSTLLDDIGGMDELNKGAKDLARQFGQAPAQQAKAYYQIISAGASTAAEATETLTAANKLAIGGVTDVRTAADGLTSIMNAYGSEVGTATDVSDAMFVAMKAGKTTIEELSGSIGMVAPLAAQAGASLEEVLAATAALTKGGMATSESVRGLRQILASVVKPSSEAAAMAEKLEIEFNAAALQTQGLAGFLDTLMVATGGSTEQLAQLFGGVEALVPVLALAGGAADDFSDILVGMEGKAGATETAFEKMGDTAEFKFNQLKAAGTVALIELGTVILDQLVPVMDEMIERMDRIAGGIGSVVRVIRILDDIEVRRQGGMFMFGNQNAGRTGATPGGGLDRPAGFGPRPTDGIFAPASGGADFLIGPMLRAQIERSLREPVTELDKFAKAVEAAADKFELAFRDMNPIREEISAALGGPGASSLRNAAGGVDLTGRSSNGRGGSALAAGASRHGSGSRSAQIFLPEDFEALAAAAEEQKEAQNEALRSGLELVSGLARMGDAFGMLGTAGRQAIFGVEGLIRSIDSFSNAQNALGKISGAIGMAGAALQVGAALFGETAADRERQAAIRSNTQALNRLRESYEATTRGDFGSGIGVIDAIQALADGTLAGGKAALEKFFDNRDFLQGLADQFGITGLDSDNLGVIESALQALEDALREASKRAFEFADTLEGQKSRLDARNELFGITDPAEQLRAQMQMLSQFAPELFGGLSGLDFGSADSRELLQAAIRDMFTQFEAGTLDKGLLDGFESGQQFIDTLLDINRGLGKFGETVDAVTGSVSNLPNAVPLRMFEQMFGGIGSGGGSPAPIFLPPGTEPQHTGPGPHGGAPVVINIENLRTQAKDGKKLLEELRGEVVKAARGGNPIYWPSRTTVS